VVDGVDDDDPVHDGPDVWPAVFGSVVTAAAFWADPAAVPARADPLGSR
jgi:hypothetical protein